MRTNRNIILCGFMGCGKTTVGKILAKNMGRVFIDTDNAIEKKAMMPVSKIFEKFGESYFRSLETSLCTEISNKKNHVISTGGGLVISPVNVGLLKQNGIIIFIDVSTDEIRRRIGGDKSRPLLNSDGKSDVLNELYQKRIGIYRSVSDIIINGEKSPSVLANDIIKSVSIY